jgi:hypothetical protein
MVSVAAALLFLLTVTVTTDHSFYAALLLQLQHQPYTSPLTVTELTALLAVIKGDDYRLMRWDATEYTAIQQATGGCDALPAALRLLATATTTTSTTTNGSRSSNASSTLLGLACEYITFCVTDHAGNRATLAQHGPAVYETIVSLLGEQENTYASAMAAHVVYIASFANADNIQGFYQADAVPALAAVVKDIEAAPFQTMWAAAALQNLAASYCATADDGRCYWDWPYDDTVPAHVGLTADSLPVIADGTAVRQAMVQDTELVQRLLELACQGPVRGTRPTNQNPFPGVNAVAGQHDASPAVAPWAAAGALKNLALSPAGKSAILQSSNNNRALQCLCRLQHSADWLEENKGEGALHHLRQGGPPCWWDDAGNTLCVDSDFLDAEGYTCTDYADASEAECKAVNAKQVAAHEACCACGGGDRERTRRTEEL